MMEQTAIQKLIEYFQQQLDLQKTSEIKYTTEEAFVDAIDICKNSLKIEKEQIKEAFNVGNIGDYGDKGAEKYYIETYGK